MGKRGPKKYEDETRARIRPMRVVARQLGISVRTAENDYRSAMNKLRHVPGAFEIILRAIHAVDAEQHDLIQCASIECHPEFVKLFGDTE